MKFLIVPILIVLLAACGSRNLYYSPDPSSSGAHLFTLVDADSNCQLSIQASLRRNSRANNSLVLHSTIRNLSPESIHLNGQLIKVLAPYFHQALTDTTCTIRSHDSLSLDWAFNGINGTSFHALCRSLADSGLTLACTGLSNSTGQLRFPPISLSLHK